MARSLRSGRARAGGSTRTGAGRNPGAAPAFPLIVALLSTTAALGLFFSTTVPAIAELRYLDQVEQERRDYRRELTEALAADALHRISLEVDLQSLLVELDRRGIFAGPILSKAGLFDPEPEPQDPTRRDREPR